ncbi:MAG: hypothetical protein IJ899_10930 [Blautia sp.]|nr:hypothetical protein [Blautia sp.]
MQIGRKFTTGVHIITAINYFKDMDRVNSEFIAGSFHFVSCLAFLLLFPYNDCIDKSLILRIASQRSCSRVSPPGSVVAKRMPLACSNLQPLGIRSFCADGFACSDINSAK